MACTQDSLRPHPRTGSVAGTTGRVIARYKPGDISLAAADPSKPQTQPLFSDGKKLRRIQPEPTGRAFLDLRAAFDTAIAHGGG